MTAFRCDFGSYSFAYLWASAQGAFSNYQKHDWNLDGEHL